MAQGIVPTVRSVLVLALVAAALVLLPAAASAQSTPSGTWVGKMKTPDGEEFEITLVLDGLGESWTGSLQDEFMGELPLENLKVTATRINFTYRPTGVPFPATFSGSYVAAQDRITGTFVDYVPPEFRVESLGENRHLIHYISKREGLTPFVVGLLNGLSLRFETELEIVSQETLPVESGEHTVFEVVVG